MVISTKGQNFLSSSFISMHACSAKRMYLSNTSMHGQTEGKVDRHTQMRENKNKVNLESPLSESTQEFCLTSFYTNLIQHSSMWKWKKMRNSLSCSSMRDSTFPYCMKVSTPNLIGSSGMIAFPPRPFLLHFPLSSNSNRPTVHHHLLRHC
jgi:hypothetical protein